MSDSPAPPPQSTPEPSEPQAPPVPAPKEPKPSRIRRMWRWSKKWGKRFAIVLLVLILVTSVVYSVHRHQAFKASDKALADVRAELDATEPGWRYEDIEAAHNATKPPDDKNSYPLIENFPELKQPFPGHLFASNVVDSYPLKRPPTNTFPPVEVVKYASSAEKDIPIRAPSVQQLRRATSGWIPLYGEVEAFASPRAEPLYRVAGVATILEVVSLAPATRGDSSTTVAYAHSVLNVGRSIGSMPRSQAQTVRRACSVRAARIVIRLLAWCDPDIDTTELQKEFVLEAENDWVPMALRAERAVINRIPERLTVDEEARFLLTRFLIDPEAKVNLEERAFIAAARPYRGDRTARSLRDVTPLISRFEKLSPHERLKVVDALPRDWLPRDSPTAFHGAWDRAVRVSASDIVISDCRTRAVLRTAAVALAVERFRRVKQRWPASLEEIPKDSLGAIPVDPFDGKPLRYKHLEDGVVVYSVGTDGRDDSGDVVQEDRGQELDIGFRLWNPELRGLPWKDPLAQPDKPDAPEPDKP